MKSTITILFLCFIFIIPSAASACPCLALEADGKEKAKEVFTGVVVNVENIYQEYQRTTFKIIESEKGYDSDTIQVISNSKRNNGCYAQFEKGETYRVYTYEYEYLVIENMQEKVAEHYTSACSRKKYPES